tara:strand:- start:34 stop:627 length:594 start_codon:yes stop_codon:yes gene_type:complete
MPLPIAAVVWTGVRWAVKKGIKKAAKRAIQKAKKTPKPSSKATQKPLRSRGTSRATPAYKVKKKEIGNYSKGLYYPKTANPRKGSMFTRTKGLSTEGGARAGAPAGKSRVSRAKRGKPQSRYKEKKILQEWSNEYKPLKGTALVRHLNRKHKKPTKYGTRTHSTTIRRNRRGISEPGGLKVFDKNFRALKKSGYKYY